MVGYPRVFIALVFIVVGGCATAPPPPPAVVSYLDVPKKQAYIHGARSTLKIFHDTALDLRNRRKDPARQELAVEVDRYIEAQVEPIVGDFEANNNLATRLEVAELQLLCGLVYLELEEYHKARVLLDTMEKRYGNHPGLLSVSIDRGEMGFRNIGEGMKTLNERLFREFLVLPPSPSS